MTPWTVAHQAPLSIWFSRQEHWSGLPFPSPGDLPDPGIEPRSPTWQADSLPSEVQVQVVQLSPTLCDPMGYTVHGILQARILEWVAFPYSRGSSRPRAQSQVSCIAGRFFTIWVTREAWNKGYWISNTFFFKKFFISLLKRQGKKVTNLLECCIHFYVGE